jgi:hypothetical protein
MSRWILAQNTMQRKTELLRQMGSRFEQSDPDLYWKIPVVIFLLVLACVLLWVLYELQRRREEKRQVPQPMRLFLKLMRRIELTIPDIWQIWRLARRLQLEQPAALLISPGYFDKAVADDCADPQGRILYPARRRRLLAVRSTLFGSVAPRPS